MDRNTIIGLTLIFILFIVWQQIMTPSAEELKEQKRLRDSIALVQEQQILADSLKEASPLKETVVPEIPVAIPDSIRVARLSGNFGPFSASAAGEEQEVVLENDLFKITFSNKGGIIREVELKEHSKIIVDDQGKETKHPLKLLEDDKNRFYYFLPVSSLPGGGVKTEDLYFSVIQSDSAVVFRADAGEGRYFEQSYRISPGDYGIDYDIRLEGLNNVLDGNADRIRMTWLNYLDKIEVNTKYERNYSTIYYKPSTEDPDYCSCTSDDTEDISNRRIKWIAHTNQFFNSALIAEDPFLSAMLEIKMSDPEAEDLKMLRSELAIPFGRSQSEVYAMHLYVGPNEFDRLYAMGHDLQDIIPFGRSVFGTINRWVIRPIFNFLSGFIGSKGIVILALTFLVKLLLFPLTYRMLYSQSKMGALKPQLEGMKEKFKDDPQKQQMETMKVYREFGVNPLGGCLPMILQMPIWIALYRFFPASIEFRQASFLWATDLSSYDVIMRLPFEVPLGFGAHISLFTILWAITTLIYTYYNTRHMDMSANPAMKYMQYIMPIFFLGFFNSFASGLTAYLLFSNLLNIGQTIVTKNYIIDNEKILKELEENRKKPKKQGGFQQRLEAALKEQQRVQQQKETQKKDRKPKK